MTGARQAVQAFARLAHQHGCNVIPPSENGRKQPWPNGQGRWAEWQERRTTDDEIEIWYGQAQRTGVGIVTGSISGNEVLDFDQPGVYHAWRDICTELGIIEIVDRIVAGWADETPSGGRHLYYRCATIEGNKKLAQTNEMTTLIETRGEGGFIVAAPSCGGVHPTGKPYRLLSGGPATIVTITTEERAALHDAARALDERPERTHEPFQANGGNGRLPEGAPGTDFNARGDWNEVLIPMGWKHLFQREGVGYWCRPGKQHGISGTTNWGGHDLFHCFTSSTTLEPDTSYSKWRTFAFLHHGGDFKAAARALSVMGYGERQLPPVLTMGENRIEGDNPMGEPAHEDGREAESGTGDSGTGHLLHVVNGSAAPQRAAIVVTNRSVEHITPEAWAAIGAANDPPMMFRYAGIPSRIERDDKHTPFSQMLTPDRMRHEAARSAGWFRLKEVKDAGLRSIPVTPPMDVIRDMLAESNQDIPLPILDGITESPTFAQDGSLPSGPGYHVPGRTFYAPAPGFEVAGIPDRPTRAQVAAARSLLLDDLLVDFPFVGDGERAHMAGLLLLPFMRGLIDGPTPLHLMEKPTAGTGASLLADVVARLATGRAVGAMTECGTDDEWRKKLTSTLIAGRQIVLIDNLRERLDSAALAAALTAAFHEDRLLGSNTLVRIPVRCVWVASGNNPALSSEIVRRTVRIRMDAKVDRPGERDVTTFKHPALLQWVSENRAQLVAACLTIGRAWLAEGRPVAAGNPTLGGFEDWARVMGGVLEVAEIPGFLRNRAEFYEQADAEGAALRAFIGTWWDTHENRPVGVAELFPIASGDASMLDLGTGTERSQRSRLGHLLSQLRDRRYTMDDGRLVGITPGPKVHNTSTYRLRDVATMAVQPGLGSEGDI